MHYVFCVLLLMALRHFVSGGFVAVSISGSARRAREKYLKDHPEEIVEEANNFIKDYNGNLENVHQYKKALKQKISLETYAPNDFFAKKKIEKMLSNFCQSIEDRLDQKIYDSKTPNDLLNAYQESSEEINKCHEKPLSEIIKLSFWRKNNEVFNLEDSSETLVAFRKNIKICPNLPLPDKIQKFLNEQDRSELVILLFIFFLAILFNLSKK